jgi:hypothetical protein
MICGLLRTAGIVCNHRPLGSGEDFGGAREVVVHAEDLEAARSVLAEQS